MVIADFQANGIVEWVDYGRPATAHGVLNTPRRPPTYCGPRGTCRTQQRPCWYRCAPLASAERVGEGEGAGTEGRELSLYREGLP